jgi:hypothetical protein
VHGLSSPKARRRLPCLLPHNHHPFPPGRVQNRNASHSTILLSARWACVASTSLASINYCGRGSPPSLIPSIQALHLFLSPVKKLYCLWDTSAKRRTPALTLSRNCGCFPHGAIVCGLQLAYMSPPSDGRQSTDSRQPLPPLTTALSDLSTPSQQHPRNKQPDERSPVTPGGGVGGQVGGAGGNGVISHGGSPKSHVRICQKCGQVLTGQFVRALGGTYHLDCFKCKVSSASLLKFFFFLARGLSACGGFFFSPPFANFCF